MSSVAIYPGSFDPITMGHLSVLSRSATVFDKVYLLIVHNSSKIAAMDLETRVAMAEGAIAEAGLAAKCSVQSLHSGLLIKKAQELGANAIVKGFRNSADIDYELPMAKVNHDLAGIETVFIASEGNYGHVSSSLVKEVFALGGDISKYVTPSVLKKMQEGKE
ncbi:MAG: pantetheine-phosphate adenylyltransferase [Aquiluna sp.]|nr:pantetheine-phosphate adenylyltransferase [Aquiluna sp.]